MILQRLNLRAHRIKPSFDNLGINSLKEPIREIEALAANNEASDRLTELIEMLNSTLKQVVQSLQQKMPQAA